MSEAQQLYRLQGIDIDIEEVSRELQSIEEQLGETEELRHSRQALTEAQNQLQLQQKTLKELEWNLSEIAVKLKELDGKLYGGTVKNSKELGNFEREAKMFKDKQSSIEDRSLELMDSVEDSHAAVTVAASALAEVEAQWKSAQTVLREEHSRLESRMAELNKSRAELAKQLRPGVLDIYEDLRQNKRGRAVAKVEQNTCQGCRITLPTNEVQMARMNPRLVFCSSCGRILLATR